jgi:hypothetical protein
MIYNRKIDSANIEDANKVAAIFIKAKVNRFTRIDFVMNFRKMRLPEHDIKKSYYTLIHTGFMSIDQPNEGGAIWHTISVDPLERILKLKAVVEVVNRSEIETSAKLVKATTILEQSAFKKDLAYLAIVSNTVSSVLAYLENSLQ